MLNSKGFLFFVLPSTAISSHLKEKRDAAVDYLKYWLTVNAALSYPSATHYLGPGGWAVKFNSCFFTH